MPPHATFVFFPSLYGCREPLGHARRMHQAASATAQGTNSATASAIASNIAGAQQAATNALATGANASTSGISIAAGQIDTCFSGPQQNLSVCRTLAPSARSVNCTDIAPDNNFSCSQQASDYKKCNSDFMFVGSYCLKSCNRCGCKFTLFKTCIHIFNSSIISVPWLC